MSDPRRPFIELGPLDVGGDLDNEAWNAHRRVTWDRRGGHVALRVRIELPALTTLRAPEESAGLKPGLGEQPERAYPDFRELVERHSGRPPVALTIVHRRH